MTRDEAREILLSGECIHGGCWTWTAHYMTCPDNCCDDSFTDVEQTLDTIETMTNWKGLTT